MDLFETVTILIELRCSIYWADSDVTAASYTRRPLAPLAFAAPIITDAGMTALQHSIDTACLRQLRHATRHLPFGRRLMLDYDVERYFAWGGFGKGYAAGSGAGSKSGGGPVSASNEVACETCKSNGCNGDECQYRMVSWSPSGNLGDHGNSRLLPISCVHERDLQTNLELMEKRGQRDWILVDMAVEIEAPEVAKEAADTECESVCLFPGL
ncbi:hypothetical protein VTK73DRAFT_6233 [Phialemonium thermophilum]|uniref:Uncharacterized protein n=1 Tax=Phialemonium thermophilum TaxID=223376 RepID=A0ABR3WKM7_9PEZI